MQVVANERISNEVASVKLTVIIVEVIECHLMQLISQNSFDLALFNDSTISGGLDYLVNSNLLNILKINTLLLSRHILLSLINCKNSLSTEITLRTSQTMAYTIITVIFLSILGVA